MTSAMDVGISPVSKQAIQTHYDLATPFYWLLWGPHIHHGLWQANESPARAQRQLIEFLADFAGIQPQSRVLDVGCGMGGTSIYLARKLGCKMLGLTLSPVQRLWAQWTAWSRGVGRQVRFLCRDAEHADFPAASFDVLWSVECTEHLFDKAAFFRRAAAWLVPEGRLVIAAWLAADRPHDSLTADSVRQVCDGFLCPSLGTADDYLAWFRQAGLHQARFVDLTGQVQRTWEICRQRVRHTGVHWLARLAGRSMVRFLEHFDTILHAYRSGTMKYGCFVAQK